MYFFNFYCFAGCLSLKQLTLPASLESIATGAFSGCDSLIEIIYCGNNIIRTPDVFSSNNILIYVSSGYKSEYFSSLNVLHALTDDCKLIQATPARTIGPKIITCQSSRILSSYHTLIFSILIGGSH